MFKNIFCGTGSCVRVDEINLSDKEYHFLDVRTPREFIDGHIAGATNVPLQSLAHHIDEIKNIDLPIVAYCRSGKRSEIATTILRAKGIEVYNGGGFVDLMRKIEKSSPVEL